MILTTTTRHRGLKRSGVLLTAAALIGSGLTFGSAAHAAADEVHEVTFTSGPQTTFTIPADATSVRLVVAGAQGSTRSLTRPELGGAGGIATVDLGTSYNGETLDLLVGNAGYGSGAAGSYVAFEDEFLVIAGGGGLGGLVQGAAARDLPGGAGGFANGSPDGGDGTNVDGYHHSGTGAVGATPGSIGYTTTETPSAPNGTVATIVDGTIIPGMSSTGPDFDNNGGGQGYAGGGGGSDELLAGVGIIRSAGGGASGYLAPGLNLTSTGANVGVGTTAPAYITVTWTTPAAEEPGTDDPGTDDPGTDDPGTGEPGDGGAGDAPTRPQDGIVLPVVAG